jgi:hypothetical protein
MRRSFAARCAHRTGNQTAANHKKGLRLESLEVRALLSASAVLDSIFARPTFDSLGITNPAPQGYTPAQIRQAYGFNQISFNSGTVPGNGSGQTIAIVDAYDDPNIAGDLHTFDQTFGIADPPSFIKLNQNGGTSAPAANAGWSEEIALDVEWAHAVAPAAKILLVEANSSSLTDLLAAVDVARNTAGVSVVSMSWGSSEFSGQTQYDSHFVTPAGHTPEVFLASAGDSGAGAQWPAASPNVVAVGGTSLNLSGSSYASESAWSGSGGGYSQVESEPSFQRGAQTSGARTVPDVGYDANPNTGVAVFDSVAVNGRSGWFQIGGTSAGSPQWAALFAIADQGRALGGQAALAGGQTALYNLPSSDFHDVTSGTNGYSAKAGYDLVTGRGSPVANAVVRDLVANATSTSTAPTTPAPAPTPPAPSPSHQHHYYELVYWNHRWWLIEITTPNAVDASNNSDQFNQGMDQLASAIAASSTASSTNATTATNSATQAPATVEGANQSRAGAPATMPTDTSIVVAPPQFSGTGNDALVRADQPQPGQSIDQNEADDRNASSPAATGTNAVAPGSGDGASARGVELPPQAAMSLPGSIVDLCFANDAWAVQAANDLVALPDFLAGSWDVDLAAFAMGLALAVNCRKARAAASSAREIRPSPSLARRDRMSCEK